MDSRLLARALACGALCFSFGCTSKPGADSATEAGSSGEVGASTSSGADVSTGGTTGATGVQPSTGGSGVEPTTTDGATSGASTTGDGTTGDGTTGDGSSSGSTTGQPPWPIEMCDDILIETGPVQGTTPLGDLVFTYAAHDPDVCWGVTNSVVVYLFEETPVLDQTVLLGPATTRLTLEMFDTWWKEHGWAGEGPVHVILHEAGGMDVEAEGTMTITTLDEKWLIGELAVVAPGWALYGGFVAANCFELSGFTICE